jgi:hypothetical protein
MAGTKYTFSAEVVIPLREHGFNQAPGCALFSIARRRVPIEAAPDGLRERGIEVVIPSAETLPWQQHALPPTDVCS